MCEDLSSPVNGMIMLMGRTPGSIAMYSCDMGFRLNGEMTRTCQTDGNWSNEEPTCICEHNSNYCSQFRAASRILGQGGKLGI